MKVLFDTNAVLYYLTDKNISNINCEFAVSFITEIELLAYPMIEEKEEKIIRQFLDLVDIIDINTYIKEETINLRRKFNIKIPDAIICATAKYLDVPLITNDKQILKIKDCKCLDYEKFKEIYAK